MIQISHTRFILSFAGLIGVSEIPRTGRGRAISPQARYSTILPYPNDLPWGSEIDEFIDSLYDKVVTHIDALGDCTT